LSLTKSFELEEGLFESDGRIYLEFDRLDSVVVHVKVNKKGVGTLLWPPFKVDVTDVLKPGKNVVRFDVTNSLHNLMGPHHDKNGELHGVSPRSFANWGNWTDRYTFVPFGIQKVQLVKVR